MGEQAGLALFWWERLITFGSSEIIIKFVYQRQRIQTFKMALEYCNFLKWYYAQFSLQKLGCNCYIFQNQKLCATNNGQELALNL